MCGPFQHSFGNRLSSCDQNVDIYNDLCEVGLSELFAATPSAANTANTAALVDMTTSSIVTGARLEGATHETGDPGLRPLGRLRVRLNGIISGHEGTYRALENAGWTATAAPLYCTPSEC